MNAPVDISAPLNVAELDRRERVCRAIMESAGELATAGFRQSIAGRGFSMKGPQDYLTESDGLVEDHIRRRLAEQFPEDGFLGEEGVGASRRASGLSIQLMAPPILPAASRISPFRWPLSIRDA